MNKRVFLARKALKLSQDAFGKRIGISGASISKLESGENNPSEQTIKLICREFGVNYDWLKNGNEPMMVPPEYLNRAKVDKVLDSNNEFVKQIFYSLAEMPESWWNEAEKVLRKALGKEKGR